MMTTVAAITGHCQSHWALALAAPRADRSGSQFLHYWGRGKAEDLARALRRTLDAQRAANGEHAHSG
jgi:hypothetical protein